MKMEKNSDQDYKKSVTCVALSPSEDRLVVYCSGYYFEYILEEEKRIAKEKKTIKTDSYYYNVRKPDTPTHENSPNQILDLKNSIDSPEEEGEEEVTLSNEEDSEKILLVDEPSTTTEPIEAEEQDEKPVAMDIHVYSPIKNRKEHIAHDQEISGSLLVSEFSLSEQNEMKLIPLNVEDTLNISNSLDNNFRGTQNGKMN
eukprot:CAMPEP_0117418236 /NCGR_PEP_ID=MMETSP0758-20121206/62_1 /TAXON_ID=63605 /ORGANISM="Percolomonas cosmopolitus, Strain AE-1 (ATCC 50343)" /LENGTH=199 /DNA_ID=CAMNT_0005198627 /DNA_START=5043 /DNA_END=5639 /DNA_ORIENTATION=+